MCFAVTGLLPGVGTPRDEEGSDGPRTPAEVEETTELAVAGEGQSRQVAAPPRHDRLHRLRVRRARHAGHGGVQRRAGFTWLILLAVLFVLPYALLMAEVGSAFTQEGGPTMGKLAFGPCRAHLGRPLLGHQPDLGGGSLPLSRPRRGTRNVFSASARGGGVGDYLLQIPLHLGLSITVAIVSLRKRGKSSPTSAPSCASTLLTLVHAHHGDLRHQERHQRLPGIGDLKPTGAIFLALVPLLLFNYVGFELQNGAAEEMEDPQKRRAPLGRQAQR